MRCRARKGPTTTACKARDCLPPGMRCWLEVEKRKARNHVRPCALWPTNQSRQVDPGVSVRDSFLVSVTYQIKVEPGGLRVEHDVLPRVEPKTNLKYFLRTDCVHRKHEHVLC